MGGAGALANIKVHAYQDWWPGRNPSRCLMPVGCGTGATKHLALEHLAGGGGRFLHMTYSLSK